MKKIILLSVFISGCLPYNLRDKPYFKVSEIKDAGNGKSKYSLCGNDAWEKSIILEFEDASDKYKIGDSLSFVIITNDTTKQPNPFEK